MPAKQLVFDAAARDALRRGADRLADTVAVTLGPRGRNVILDKKWGPPAVSSDGVTIARDIELQDPYENMGAQLLKEAASKTNDVAGDGTTTATVLARRMIRLGLRNLAAGASPSGLRDGIVQATDAAEEAVRAMRIELGGTEDVRRVASISASDSEIGDMIARGFDKVGREGVITVEEGRGVQPELEITDGMQLDRGFISGHFVNDERGLDCVLENLLVLVVDRKISSINDMLPYLETVLQQRRPLLVIAEDVEGEALATLAVNKLRGTLSVCAIKAPGFGERREAMLEDIAVLTGATVVTEKRGLRLDAADPALLGSARRMVATKDKTTIVDGGGDKAAIEDRCAEIRRQLDETESQWDREKLQERLAKLSSGVAVLRVGAPTEVALKELKSRVEDALAAVRAAIEDGIVPGGGVSLLRAQPAVDALQLEGDARTGAQIVRRALEEPLRVIAENGGDEGSVVAHEVRKLTSPTEGYDAARREYADLIERGILDPTKVVCAALRNAASIATMVLSTEALISDAPEKPQPVVMGNSHTGHGHGGDMGDMDEMDF